MKTWFIVPVLGIVIAAMGCTQETLTTDAPPMVNDLRGAPAAPRTPVANGGIPEADGAFVDTCFA